MFCKKQVWAMGLCGLSMVWAEPQKLPITVVTATTTAKLDLDIPQGVLSKDMEDLRAEEMPRTLPESFKDDPSILVQKTAHGHGSPYIRGFTAFRNLFLIDGIRLNNSIFREGPNQYWNTVDSMSVSQLELVKGPASTLYGSDAIGGTLQVFSHERTYNEMKEDWNGRWYSRYASAESSWLNRFETEASLHEKLGLALGFTDRNYGDLKAGSPSSHLPNTGYREMSWDGKLSYHVSEHQRWILAHQNLEQDDVPRTHKTVHAVSFEGSSVGSELQRQLDQKRSLTYLQYKKTELNGTWADDLSLSLSHHTQEESRHRERMRSGDLRVDDQGLSVDTSGLVIQANKYLSNSTWSYGGEYYHDEVNSFKSEQNLTQGTTSGPFIQGPVADDATYDQFGLYVQNESWFGERWQAIMGLRYTGTKLKAGAVEDPSSGNLISLEDKASAWLGSLRGAYHFDGQSMAYLGVSQSFRAPNLSDLTRLDTARTNEIETPVPAGLDPERFLSFEAGYKFESERLALGLNAYYTDIRDMIIRTPTGRVISGDLEVTKKNSGKGFVTGLEWDVEFAFGEAWACRWQSAWQDGELSTYATSTVSSLQDDYISRLLPWSNRLSLSYAPVARSWGWEVSMHHASHADKLSLRDQGDTSRIPPGGTPSYVVFSMAGHYRFNDHLKLSVALENLTDEDYRTHGSGLNEPGRNAILGLEASF